MDAQLKKEILNIFPEKIPDGMPMIFGNSAVESEYYILEAVRPVVLLLIEYIEVLERQNDKR